MKELLKSLKGAILIARGVDGGRAIFHYLLPNGVVIEVTSPKKE